MPNGIRNSAMIADRALKAKEQMQDWLNWRTLSPAAKWASATLVAFSLVAAVGNDRVPHWWLWIIGNVLVLKLLALVCRNENQNGTASFFPGRPFSRPQFLGNMKALSPLLGYWWLYRQSEFLSLALIPEWQNEIALRLDHAVFGVIPTLFLFENAAPWLTEWMAASYFLYVPALVTIPLVYSFRGNPEARDGVLHGLAVAYTVSFSGFLLFPLQAPRFSLAEHLTEPLTGGLWLKIVGMQLYYGVVRFGGCLPSAHVAAATVLMAAAWRLGLRWFLAGLFIIAPIYLSTVYLHLHYAVDVLAGWIVGAFAVWLTRKHFGGEPRHSP